MSIFRRLQNLWNLSSYYILSEEDQRKRDSEKIEKIRSFLLKASGDNRKMATIVDMTPPPFIPDAQDDTDA